MFSCFLDTIDFKINHKFNNIKKKTQNIITTLW